MSDFYSGETEMYENKARMMRTATLSDKFSLWIRGVDDDTRAGPSKTRRRQLGRMHSQFCQVRFQAHSMTVTKGSRHFPFALILRLWLGTWAQDLLPKLFTPEQDQAIFKALSAEVQRAEHEHGKGMAVVELVLRLLTDAACEDPAEVVMQEVMLPICRERVEASAGIIVSSHCTACCLVYYSDW